MGKEEDCTRSVQETVSLLGGIDVLISNAGYTRFSKFSDLYGPTAEDWDTCFAVNVKAQTYLMREAMVGLFENSFPLEEPSELRLKS